MNYHDVMEVYRRPMSIRYIPRIISYCSSFNCLSIGDVIVTGTPGGVGFKRNPPIFMKPGDNVEIEITEIGILSNTIKDEII